MGALLGNRKCDIIFQHLLKRDLLQWQDDLDAAAWDRPWWLPSRKAARARADAPIDERTKDEWQIAGHALVSLLVWWASRRKRIADRQTGERVLLSWLIAFWPQDCQILADTHFDDTHRCCAQPIDNGACSHVNACCRFLRSIPSVLSPQARMAQWLVCLRKTSDTCVVVFALLRTLIDMLAVAISQHTATLPEDPRLLEHLVHLQGPRKKRRIDEDYRAAVIDKVNSCLAPSEASVVRCDGAVAPEVATAWRKTYVAQWIAAGHLTYAESNTLSLAMDGARFGQPSEETLSVACYCPTKNVATWLPPQAPSCSRNRAP